MARVRMTGIGPDGVILVKPVEPQPSYDELREELRVTDKILAEYKRVLDAIPECPRHGPCVPHALEWIERMKRMEEEWAAE